MNRAHRVWTEGSDLNLFQEEELGPPGLQSDSDMEVGQEAAHPAAWIPSRNATSAL